MSEEIKKLDEQEFKQVTEHQEAINKLLLQIGALESQKHAALHEISDVNKDGEEMKRFQSLSMEAFQFLNSAISHMKFGIENLRKNCGTCGQEVHTEMAFPNGASGIFVVHDAFERYFEE